MKLSKFTATINPKNIKARHAERKAAKSQAKALDDFELEEMIEINHFQKVWFGRVLDEEAAMNSYQQPGVEM